MGFFDHLSKPENYQALVGVAKFTIRGHFSTDPEDIADIAAEALEKLLDYFERKPEKLLEVESKEPVEMANYLKKAVRNHTINILKKRNREKKAETALKLGLTKADSRNLTWVEDNYGSHDGGLETPERGRRTFKRLKLDIHAFIEGTYSQSKWIDKKRIIDIFFERFEKNLSLTQIQSAYPERNIPSLNSEANRIIRKFRSWKKMGSDFVRFSTMHRQD